MLSVKRSISTMNYKSRTSKKAWRSRRLKRLQTFLRRLERRCYGVEGEVVEFELPAVISSSSLNACIKLYGK